MLIARLAILNETLAHRTFLVGERLSLADLVMATTLVSAFRCRDLLGSFSEILNLLFQQLKNCKGMFLMKSGGLGIGTLFDGGIRSFIRWTELQKREAWGVPLGMMIVCCVSLTIYFIVEIWSTEWLVGWTWLGFARSSSNKQGWEQWLRVNSLFSQFIGDFSVAFT